MPNLLRRVMVAALGIPVLLYAAVHGGWLLATVVAMIQVVALWEWRKLAAAVGANLLVPGAIVCLVAVDYWIFGHASRQSVGIVVIAISAVFLAEVFRRDHQPLRNLGVMTLFISYVAIPLALWYVIADPPAAIRWKPAGPLAILFVTTWICDTAAYFGGKQFGRHKLHEAASPNKTVEGFVAGVILSAAILPIAAALRLASPTALDYVILPLIVGLAGQIGDLLESLMKREVRIKDTSSVLPGHGGFLDRFDSLLISTPLLFAYLYLSPA